MSTCALLLAAVWPTAAAPERVIVEADCAGGVFGARYQVGVNPGTVSLISSCRRGDGAPRPSQHGRLLAEGLWLVPGPEVADEAEAAWRSGAADVARVLGADERLWLVDAGRLGPANPVRAVAASAVLNVVISGSAIEDIVQVPARLASLDALAPTAVIVVGKSGYDEGELERFLGVRTLWTLREVDDASQLVMRAIQGGRSRRSPLWRAGFDIAADLAAMVQPGQSTEYSDEQNANEQEMASWPPPAVVAASPRPPTASPAIQAAAANAARLKSANPTMVEATTPSDVTKGGHRD